MHYKKRRKLKLLDGCAQPAYHLLAYLDRLRERPLEAGATTERPFRFFRNGANSCGARLWALGPIDRRQVERRAQRRGNGLRAAPLLRGYVNLFRSERSDAEKTPEQSNRGDARPGIRPLER